MTHSDRPGRDRRAMAARSLLLLGPLVIAMSVLAFAAHSRPDEQREPRAATARLVR